MSWESGIVRVPTGYLNTVDDLYPGGGTATNKFGGQLGARLALDTAQAAQLSKTTTGTLYSGVYQYVKLKAGATVPVRGAAVFWDNADPDGDGFTVTQVENTTTLTAASLAGIWLNPDATAGQYTWIQIAGIATVKYVATITGTKATGRPVFISIAGTTSIGLADVLDDIVAVAGARFFERYMGWAIDLPADDSTGRVQLTYPLSPRG